MTNRTTDRWESMLDELVRQNAELRRLDDAVSRLTAQVTSTDKLVTMTVNARGLPVGLEIDPRAMRRYRADQLSALLLGLIADADERLRDRRDALAADLVALSPGYRDVDADEAR